MDPVESGAPSGTRDTRQAPGAVPHSETLARVESSRGDGAPRSRPERARSSRSRMSQTRSTRDPETPLQEAILTEARRLLETEGYAALSTRRIASAVGCTATSIYLHFKSKDSLIYALIDEGFTELNRRVFEVSRAEADPISALHSVARAYVDFGLERPEYYEIMFMLRAEQMERYPVDAYRRARRSLEVFAELTALPTREAARRGVTVWSTLHGLVSLLVAQRIDVRLDREALIEDTIQAACLGAFAALRPEQGQD